jgi:transcriptional regulator with XRE-family HTH domain
VVTVPEIRAARALIGWTQNELAKRTGIPLRSLKRIELDQASLTQYAGPIEQAFTDAGVLILSSRKEGVGVRLMVIDVD